MRGTSTMADLTGDLLRSAGARLKCLILAGRFATLTKKLYDPNVQLAAEEGTTKILDEVVQIHGVLNQQMQMRMQAGNMEAARDLRQVTTSLLQTAQDLENALDKYIFGADVEETSAPVPLRPPPEIARYDKPAMPPPKPAQKPSGKSPNKKAKAKPPRAASTDDKKSGKQRIILIALLVVALGGTLWTYRNSLFGKPEAGFVTEDATVTLEGVNIWRVTTDPKMEPMQVRIVTDASYKTLPVEKRPAFLAAVKEYVQAEYGPDHQIVVFNHVGKVAARELKGEWQIEALPTN